MSVPALLESALKLASEGRRVFPLIPRGKKPALTDWPNRATCDQSQVRILWEPHPDANIGLACGVGSGVFVIDIDGPEGETSWKELSAEIDIPLTLEQTTGRERGRQLFFRYPEGREIRNRTDVRPKVDVRGEGGYVVVAPSIHPNGKQYQWVVVDDGKPDLPWLAKKSKPVAIAEAPEALLDIITKPKPKDMPVPSPVHRTESTPVIERAKLYLRECEPAIQGSGGHDSLLWAARSLVVGFQLSDADALALLWNEFNPRCSPSWDQTNPGEQKDFERKVGQARETPGQKPAGWLLDEYGLRSGDDALQALGRNLASGLLGGMNGSAPISESAPAPELRRFPMECLPEEVMEYVMKVADVNVVDPAGVALSVLSAGGSAMGNAFRLQLKKGFEVPPIIWGLIVARSGSNKSGPFREIIKPLREPMPLNLVENVMVNPQGQLLIEDATTEAVLDVLSRSPRGLCMANGEAAGWVGAFDRYSGGGGGKKKGVSVDESIWLKLWDCDTYQKNRKTESENILIHSAACGVIGCIQPEKMAESFDPSQFSSGLVPRLLVVSLPPRVREWSEAEMTDDDRAFWKDMVFYLRSRPFKSCNPNTGEFDPNKIELSADAKTLYVQEFNRLAHEINASDDTHALFISKAQGGIGRIALVLHGMESFCQKTNVLNRLSGETMERGITLYRYFITEQLAIYGLAGEQFRQKRNEDLVHLIKTRWDGSVSLRDLQRSNQKKYPTRDAVRDDVEEIVKAGLAEWDAMKKSVSIK